MKRSILVLIIVSTSFFAQAQARPQPLFIKAKCDGKLSSLILTALIEAASASPKFRLASNLDDNGRLDNVQTIYLTCVENKDVTAVATQFGIAKCESATICHSVIDGLSLNAALCNANLSSDCGRALFKVFEAYVNRPNPSQLKIE